MRIKKEKKTSARIAMHMREDAEVLGNDEYLLNWSDHSVKFGLIKLGK